MVIFHKYPLAIVDHVGFQDFVSDFRPNFKIAERNTLKQDIKKTYNDEKQKTMVEIDKDASKVAITTNLWTANNSKRVIHGNHSALHKSLLDFGKPGYKFFFFFFFFIRVILLY